MRLHLAEALMAHDTINWTSRSYDGTGVPVSASAADGVSLIARHMAATHYELIYQEECKAAGRRANVIGTGSAVAHGLHETNPKMWEHFKGAAVTLLQCMHGSGEKGLPLGAPKDSAAYFMALHEFAAEMRR